MQAISGSRALPTGSQWFSTYIHVFPMIQVISGYQQIPNGYQRVLK